MKNYRRLTFVLLLYLAFSLISANASETTELKISSGDIVSVFVVNEPELSVNKTSVSEWGSIYLPLLGTVELKGKTPTEAKAFITQLYTADYLKQPIVEFIVEQYRPFIVVGEVNQPGNYLYVEGMTVQSAIEAAGGFTENTTRKAISLLSETSLTGPVQAAMTDEVQPGDVITIE